MTVRMFNLGGHQFMGIQKGGTEPSTSIRRINPDGTTTLVAEKVHWGDPGDIHTKKSIIKRVYDSFGVRHNVAYIEKPIAGELSSFNITNTSGKTLIKGRLKGGKLFNLGEISPQMLLHPEEIKGNARRFLNMVRDILVKVR